MLFDILFGDIEFSVKVQLLPDNQSKQNIGTVSIKPCSKPLAFGYFIETPANDLMVTYE